MREEKKQGDPPVRGHVNCDQDRMPDPQAKVEEGTEIQKGVA